MTSYTGWGSQTSGVWLVASPGGAVTIDKLTELPPPDDKTRFYWLGATAQQAGANINRAVRALGVSLGGQSLQDLGGLIAHAFQYGSAAVPASNQGTKPAPTETASGGGAQGGVLDVLPGGETVKTGANAVASALSSPLAAVEGLLTSGGWWKGLALVIAGAVLLIIALHSVVS